EVMDGPLCRADVLVPPADGPPEPGVPKGARPVAKLPTRLVILTDADRRVRKFIVQHLAGGRWTPNREMRIDYDVPVDAARLAADPPARARAGDAGHAF